MRDDRGPAGGPLTFKVRGTQTDGALTAFENVIAPGDGPPLHVHANDDEAWYVLDGELRFRLDDMERFFDRFAELPAFDPSAFGLLGGEVGIDVVGPPLAQQG